MTYNEFIENILNTRGRFNCGEQYHERHHILPKSCGGSNDKENLIDLLPEEHYLAHKLLMEENPDNDKLVYAFFLISSSSLTDEDRYQLTPEEYAQARQKFSEMLKNRYKNKENHPCYGKHISEERKRKIGEINKGNKYCVGRVISEETRKKIGDANRNPSEETRQKMSQARKGKHMGGENSNAKPVIRLSDGKIYSCAKEAAEDNNVKYSTFKSWVQKDKSFMYYKKWLEQQNET